MSKRHAANRRRAYGRRQHEIHERMDRRGDRSRADRGGRIAGDMGLEAAAYLDSSSAEPPFGFAD